MAISRPFDLTTATGSAQTNAGTIAHGAPFATIAEALEHRDVRAAYVIAVVGTHDFFHHLGRRLAVAGEPASLSYLLVDKRGIPAQATVLSAGKIAWIARAERDFGRERDSNAIEADIGREIILLGQAQPLRGIVISVDINSVVLRIADGPDQIAPRIIYRAYYRADELV